MSTQSQTWQDSNGAREMDSLERAACIAGGSLLAAFVLSRHVIRDSLLAAAGGYLLYRGVMGRCPLSEMLVERACELSRDKIPQRPSGASYSSRAPGAPLPRHEQVDPIDEAAMESFPASDPPASTGAAASPSQVGPTGT